MTESRWLRRLGRVFGRAARPAHRNPAPAVSALAPVSRPEHHHPPAAAWRDFLPLPNDTPFEMLRVYRVMRDNIPDVSDAVWTWKRLCHAGHSVEVAEAGSDRDAAEALRRAEALARRVHPEGGGLPGLLDTAYAALFTCGAAALELVPGRQSAGLHDAVPVDVWTLRFRRERGRLQAWQQAEGESLRLPMERLVYIGLDRDGTNPYGRSMLRALPLAVKIQQRLLEDMAKATRNAGWSRLHVRHTPPPAAPGESPEDYQARQAQSLGALRDCMTGLDPDQNLVTHDNVAVSVLQADHRGAPFYDNQKAVEEQVITGLHMMPVLLGRNYGSTETYGTAQFEVVNRQVNTVNRDVGAALERMFNLDLALAGVDARLAVRMRGNRTVDVLREAEARAKEIDNALRLHGAGLMDGDALREALAPRLAG
ncbi:MAG: hypothetical protein H3C30_06750 [Candidatus Hydrogenedentes bacterium]|nr:hypothetical protein [Candidatus Hydrogenedentota bacterium]